MEHLTGKGIEYSPFKTEDKHYFGGFFNLAQNNIDDANLRLVTVNLSLGVVKSKIDDLKQQLKEAQDQQLSLMKDQAIYLAVPAQSRIKMDNLNRKNQDLQDLSNDLSAKLRQQRDTC